MFLKLSLIILFVMTLALPNAGKASPCAENLEELQRLGDGLKDKTLSPTEAREGLLTLSIIDSRVLSSKVFSEIVKDVAVKLRPDLTAPPPPLVDRNSPAYHEYDYESRSYPHQEKEREERQRQQQLVSYKSHPTPYASLPYPTRFALAQEAWQELVKFYDLPANFESATLADVERVSARAKPFELSLADMKMGYQITKEIEKDSNLKNSLTIIIADLLPEIQAKPQLVEKPEGFHKKAKASNQSTDNSPNHLLEPKIESYSSDDQIVTYVRSSPFTGTRGEVTSIPLTTLVTENYSLLFSENYFKVLEGLFGEKWLTFKQIISDFDGYAPQAKLEVTQRIWTALKVSYITSPQKLGDPFKLGFDVSNIASTRKMSPNDVAENAYLMRSIEENPEVLKAVFRLISQSLVESAKFIPRLKSSQVWQARLSKTATKGSYFTASAATGVALLTGLFSDGHVGNLVMETIAGSGLTVGAAHGLTKVSDKLFIRKQQKMLKTFREKAVSSKIISDDEAE